jgi:hypothetical protein
MEEHLFEVLSGAVAFPVAWGSLAEGAALPRAALYRVSGQTERTLEGPGLMTSRVQADCYGATYADTLVASRAIRVALDGYQGGPVLGMFLDAVRDGFEDDAQLVYRVSMTFTVTSREQPPVSGDQ